MSIVSRQTDAELLDAARAGNVAAFGALYERHGGAARTLARQIVEDESVAEDIVAETFTKILDVIRWGGGPESAFRPYLLTAVRRTVHERGTVPPPEFTPEELALRDPGVTFVDPALTGLDQSVIARAFLSLPEKWRMVLWHAEVENAKAADLAPLLGLSSHGVATLAYRAREGFRAEYLRLQLAAGPLESCRTVLERMGAYVRGGLSKSDTRRVDAHVDDCSACRAIFLELTDITRGLRVIVGPLFAGPFLAAYLSGLGLSASGGGAGSGPMGWLRRLPRAPIVVAVGTAAAVAAATVVLVSAEGPFVPGPRRGPVPTPLVPTMHAGTPPSPPSPRSPAASPAPSRSASGPAVPIATAEATGTGRAGALPRPPGTDNSGALPRKRPTSPLFPPRTSSTMRPPGTSTGDGGRSGGHTENGRAPGRPSGEPAPTVRLRPARLVAAIDPLGALVRDRPGIVGVRLRNTGGRPSGEVVASVDLPRGVSLSDTGARKGFSGAAAHVGTTDGWACRAGAEKAEEDAENAGESVRCVRAALGPGRATAVFLRVNVAADAPKGEGPAVRATSGALSVDARSPLGVQESGATARFAAHGRLLTHTIGNTLLSCPPSALGCAPARKGLPGSRDNDEWPMTPIDHDADPATTSSSFAHFDLPVGSRVLWAGLYWSATGPGTAKAGDIRVRAPRAERYVTVRAAEVLHRDLPVGAGYLAFADVTRLARTAGHAGGRWWVADVSMRAGVSRHAGWNLVVVAAEARQPYRHTAVLDTAAVIRGARGPFEVPLHGLSWVPTRARLDLVIWDGDADLARDSVALQDHRLTPRGGDARNAFDSSAGVGRNTFGLDIDTFHPILGRHPVLAISTRRDVLFFGIAAVTVPAAR